MNQQQPTSNKRPVDEKDTKSAAHGDKLEHAVEGASKPDAAKKADQLRGDEIME